MGTDLTAWADALSKFSGLLQLVYEDLAQPGVKQAGKALETVVGLGNTVLWPIALANERAKFSLQANMERYRKKAAEIPEEKVIPIAPEIGVPIVEKLAYVTDEKLADLYTELLAKAGNKDTVGKAHPSFVNVINNISPDEAVFLQFLKRRHTVTFVRVVAENHSQGSENEIGYLVHTESTRDLVFPENIRAYLSNFAGLGLLEVRDDRWLTDGNLYAEMEQQARTVFAPIVAQMRGNPAAGGAHVLGIKKGMAGLTPFGRQFIDACVRPS